MSIPENKQEETNRTTYFGFTPVAVEEKQRRVDGVFDSVADRYDLMNDLMSMGLHRLWKRFAVELAAVRPGQRVLDVASGTADVAALLARRIRPGGQLVASDINASMLMRGRDRLIDSGLVEGISYVQANAESLPFPDRSFDCVTMAFGLRNVTARQAALEQLWRVLRPGGKALILEFSHPVLKVLRPLYDQYSFRVLPALGKWIAKDEDSYRYLVESIRMHPDQETLAGMMRQAGFEMVTWYNLSGGIVALHRGYRLS